MCSIDFQMPSDAKDPSFGSGRDKLSGKTFATPQEWTDYIGKCQQANFVTAESNPKAREQAVKDTWDFLRQG